MVLCVVGHQDIQLDSDIPRELTNYISQFQWCAICESLNQTNSSAKFWSNCFEVSLCWIFPCIICFHDKIINRCSDAELTK
jgi:hypothetical protein